MKIKAFKFPTFEEWKKVHLKILVLILVITIAKLLVYAFRIKIQIIFVLLFHLMLILPTNYLINLSFIQETIKAYKTGMKIPLVNLMNFGKNI